MEHGLKDVAFYVQKQKAPWAICQNSWLVGELGHAYRGVRICETRLLLLMLRLIGRASEGIILI